MYMDAGAMILMYVVWVFGVTLVGSVLGVLANRSGYRLSVGREWTGKRRWRLPEGGWELDARDVFKEAFVTNVNIVE